MVRSRRPVAAKFLGCFDAGTRNIELYARKGDCAEFNLQPEGKQARITVGIDMRWWETLGCLVHEAAELICTDMGFRYVPAPDIAKDNGSYYFAMNHTQFSEVATRVGLFLSQAVPVL